MRTCVVAAVIALGVGLACVAYSAQTGNQEQVTVPAGEIEVSLPARQLGQISNSDLLQWVKSAAQAVSSYYGHFPASHLTVRIRARQGSGVRHGVTFPTGGGLILISVGERTSIADLRDDWTMTHEMIHLAFPSMERNHHWIEEGLSTYVEPVARAKVGQLSATEVWKQFVENMPKGQPDTDDRGLDMTHTWGRTYWGGALFCLLADVKIRERTHNHKSLQDALRAILDHGGTINQDWPIEKALTVGDAATGTKVLSDLYRETANRPVTIDLDSLWKKLGISVQGHAGNSEEITFDDHAPEAQIRRAILSHASL